MTNTNSSVEPTTTADEGPSLQEIILPPVLLLIAGFLAILMLWIITHIYRKANYSVRPISNQPSKQFFKGLVWTDTAAIQDGFRLKQDHAVPCKCDENKFLNHSDVLIVKEFRFFYNNIKELLKLSVPAIMTLAFCPFTLLLHKPLVNFFWPPEKYDSVPTINEAIACFLAPAGMVYAVSFGFAFQQVLSKQLDIMHRINEEVGQIDQVISLVRKLNWLPSHHRSNIYLSLKSEIVYMMLQFMNKTEEVKKCRESAKIWNIIDSLRQAMSKQTSDDVIDSAICRRILKFVSCLNNASDNISSLHAKMHTLQWIFLETLGYFSFMGVLMIKAESYRLELAMCILTVISITMLCFIVADLDSPFHGFFRIDLTVIIHLLDRLEKVYLTDLDLDSSRSSSRISEKLCN